MSDHEVGAAMEGLRVGPLSPDGVAAVAALSARCFARPWTEEELDREMGRDVTRVLVADRAGSVLGYGVAYVIAGECEVLTIGVDPDGRRAGVGRALLWGLVERCSKAHLEVRADNRSARALYTRFGFEEVGVRRGYYADSEDALIMAWTRPASP